MLKHKKGIIVNTSSTYGINSPIKSVYGKSGINSPIGYATTKAAIINFTKYIATHYADKNIRANVLSPGGIYNKNQTNYFKKEYNKRTPMNRMANVDEFNESVLYLISDASRYVTGSNLVVDGGWTAW
jgi:NAD(P)-dependent dehydrogenase (short-subunit alcohol dehydrogenase family)